MSGEEREYLVRQLAARAEWARLWRLILEFPLVETVTAMRHFRGDWCPADEDGQRLFALLAGTSPEAVSPVVVEAVTRVAVGSRRIHWVSFAPDGSEIGVQRPRPGVLRFATTRYALPSGRRIQRYPGFASRSAYLGQTVAYVRLVLFSPRPRFEVIRHGTYGREVLWAGLTRRFAPRLVQVPGGFVVSIGNRLLSGTATPGSGLRELPLRGLCPDSGGRIAGMATDPASGRLLITMRHEPLPNWTSAGYSIAVLNPGFQVISWTRCGQYGERMPVFCGSDLIVTQGNDGLLHSWQVGPPLACGARTRSGGRGETGFQPLPKPDRPYPIRSLPTAGLIAVRTTQLEPWTWLDARTLDRSDPPAWLGDARQFWVSPSGGHLAVRRNDAELEVRLRLDTITRLLARPLATALPADLAAVTAAQSFGLQPAAKTAIGLLRACLEYRFGSDV